MRTIQQIDNEINQLKINLENVKGTKTEVYTRIVGYYRPVKAFNKGQAVQRLNRKNYKIPSHNKLNERIK